jgi:hypothetical protein
MTEISSRCARKFASSRLIQMSHLRIFPVKFWSENPAATRTYSITLVKNASHSTTPKQLKAPITILQTDPVIRHYCNYKTQKRFLTGFSSFKGNNLHLRRLSIFTKIEWNCPVYNAGVDSEWRDKYSKTSTAIAVLIRKRVIRLLEVVLQLWNQYSG